MNLLLDVAIWPIYALGAMIVVAPLVVILCAVLIVWLIRRKNRAGAGKEKDGATPCSEKAPREENGDRSAPPAAEESESGENTEEKEGRT